MKIQRQPTEDAINPPNSELSPEPPQEPIDQKLRARCRSFPSKYACIKASVAGMMQAAESPCKIRPLVDILRFRRVRRQLAGNLQYSVSGECTSFLLLPTGQPGRPVTTMKIPENKAVILTAILFRSWLIFRSRAHCGRNV